MLPQHGQTSPVVPRKRLAWARSGRGHQRRCGRRRRALAACGTGGAAVSRDADHGDGRGRLPAAFGAIRPDRRRHRSGVPASASARGARGGQAGAVCAWPAPAAGLPSPLETEPWAGPSPCSWPPPAGRRASGHAVAASVRGWLARTSAWRFAGGPGREVSSAVAGDDDVIPNPAPPELARRLLLALLCLHLAGEYYGGFADGTTGRAALVDDRLLSSVPTWLVGSVRGPSRHRRPGSPPCCRPGLSYVVITTHAVDERHDLRRAHASPAVGLGISVPIRAVSTGRRSRPSSASFASVLPRFPHHEPAARGCRPSSPVARAGSGAALAGVRGPGVHRQGRSTCSSTSLSRPPLAGPGRPPAPLREVRQEDYLRRPDRSP